PGDARKEQGLRPRLRADSVDHPYPEGRLRPVLRRVDGRRVLMAVDARLKSTPAVADEVEDEHPAAAKPELALAAQVLVDREEHPHAEQDERYTDDLFEYRIDPSRQHRTKKERGDPQDEYHEGMAERVKRREPDGVTLLVREPRLRERVHGTGSLGRMLV